jgi:SAM-dependent methyltransferase
MDDKIVKAFEANLNGELKQIIICNSSDSNTIEKIKIRPVLLKKELLYQATEYRQTKVFHQNYTTDELLGKLSEWFEGLFKQVEIKSIATQTNILVSKKGVATVKVKKESGQTLAPILITEHDRQKQYILQEGTAIPFMVDLGIMSVDGKIIRSKYDKYKQINRYLEFIEDILPNFDKDKEVRIVDFGCGKSYLTFAMYYYLHEMMGYKIRVTGLDLKEDVIKTCTNLKHRYGYDKLEFLQGDIADYNGCDHVDMVVTLHACDTATDYALYKATNWGAKVILSVPCCQHEFNQNLSCEALQPMIKYGLIKERMASLMTDSMRANLLELLDYKVQILEFIDMEHTPKNILIRAVKKSKPLTKTEQSKLLQTITDTMQFLHVTPTFYQLIKDNIN